MEKYPSLSHTKRLFKQILLNFGSTKPTRHWIVLRGEGIHERHDTDREVAFHQESNFYWLTGCNVPGSAFVASYDDYGMWDSSRIRCELFIPQRDPDLVMWMGPLPSSEDIAKTTDVANIHASAYSECDLLPQNDSPLPVIIHTLADRTGVPLFDLQGQLQQMEPQKRLKSVDWESQYLIDALHICRRTKDEYEVAVMAQSNKISSIAHTELMQLAGQGKLSSEADVEASFVSTCRKLGSKAQSYMPIAAYGENAGTLHYLDNDESFATLKRKPNAGSKVGTVVLVDAGGEYQRYTSDITRCIPIGNGGRFTKECREIYEIVLFMQSEALSRIRAGADWEEIQRYMHTIVARKFLTLGIFNPPKECTSTSDAEDYLSEAARIIVRSGLTTAFFPHGIGHMLGLDTHDVGGLPEGRSSDPLLRYLRLRIPLEEHFVVTVEPGVYFNLYLVAPFRGSPYLNEQVLAQYWYVGGVRIEDDVVVTEDGYINLTSAPKSVADIEKLTSQ